MQSDGDLLHGQQFNPDDVVVKPYTQRMMGSDAADAIVAAKQANTEVNPIDANASEVKVFDLTAIQALLDVEVLSYPSFVNLNLPNELVSVALTSNSNTGTGSSDHPISQQDAGVAGNGSITISPRGSAQASASIMFSAQPVIKQIWAERILGTRYYFFMTENHTSAQLLTRLTTLAGATVLAYPQFKTSSHVITLKGQSVSVSVEADTTASASESSSASQTNTAFSYAYGTGYNEEVGLNTQTVQIPPTIHPLITFSVPSPATAIASVSAEASTVEILGTGVDVAEIINTIGPRTKTATASVSPASLAATSITAVPVTGLYLVDLDIQPFQFDRVRVFAEVVDFTRFA